MAQRTPTPPHNRARLLLIGIVAAVALLAIGAFAVSRGRGHPLAVDRATVAAAPMTGIVATLPPGIPTPTPLATTPPTAAPTAPPTIGPTVPSNPTAPPAAAQSQPVVAPEPRQAPAAAPGKGKGKGNDEKKGGD